jgi:hypothetical protein
VAVDLDTVLRRNDLEHETQVTVGLTVRLPKISSAQVGAAVGFGGSQISWLLSEGLAAAG